MITKFKIFENNSQYNTIENYIKIHKNKIDFNQIEFFLKKINLKKKNHISILIHAIHQITNSLILKKLINLFLIHGYNINSKTFNGNILQILLNIHLLHNDEDDFNKYKSVIILLLKYKINLLEKNKYNRNFFDDLIMDKHMLSIFLKNFSNNKYFMNSYNKYIREKNLDKFNI